MFFLLNVQNALFQDRSSFRLDRSNLHFFDEISSVGSRASFNLKTQNLLLVLYVVRDIATTIPFGSLLLSYFGVFGCQENPTFPLFSMDFLEEKIGWFILSFIFQFLIYLGLAKKPIFFLVWIQEEIEIKLGVDSKCAPKEECGKLKVKGTSELFLWINFESVEAFAYKLHL